MEPVTTIFINGVPFTASLQGASRLRCKVLCGFALACCSTLRVSFAAPYSASPCALYSVSRQAPYRESPSTLQRQSPSTLQRKLPSTLFHVPSDNRRQVFLDLFRN